MKILILGGYGVFGGRLAELLSDIKELEILIAGRTLSKATDFCKAYDGAARVTPMCVDRQDIKSALENANPDILIDASGPFQKYGSDPYHVIRTCISARVNYLDFADAADFVFDVAQFDKDAKQAKVFVLSGVSSFPVLTAAVVRTLGKDMHIETITGGIAPSPFAGIGLNVMRAVVSYAGGPVKLRRDGHDFTAHGLTESMRYTIAPPGYLPLRNLRFSLVDVPDLQVLPAEYADLRDIWMGAGPVPEILHRILNLLAKARATFKLPEFTRFSRLFYFVLNQMKFGEHRGGMFVRITGWHDGKPCKKSWHLLAEGDDGPYIPSMAIEAILRKYLSGSAPAFGARPATNDLELADFEALFETRTIHTGIRTEIPPDAPLYKHLLGTDFDQLPQVVQNLHTLTDHNQWQGHATVTPATNPLSKLIAKLSGFPTKGGDVPVTVGFSAENGVETWQRDFAGHKFKTLQSKGTGRNEHLLVERFGPASFAMALVRKGDQLHLIPRHWRLFNVPMPRFFLPTGETFETAKGDQFEFNITVRVPIAGHIVGYAGHLQKG